MTPSQIANLRIGDAIKVSPTTPGRKPWLGAIARFDDRNQIGLKESPDDCVLMWFDVRDPRLEIVEVQP
jgi:hypothetical protein